MALADFIHSLQEQDTIYSEPPQPLIRVIPPENHSIKVIPPETLAIDQSTPKVIKLKIKPKLEQPIENTSPAANILKPVEKPTENNQTANSILKPVSQTIHNKSAPAVQQTQTDIPRYIPNEVSQPKPSTPSTPIAKTEPIQKPAEKTTVTDEDIFNSTGTEYGKKDTWLNYFEKAKASRKSNPIVDRMKAGRFTITPDNKVLLLPDYDIVGKDPDDVLKDKWF